MSFADAFDRISALPLIGRLLRRRFVKFGTVGVSGVLVNIGVLYVAQEYLFSFVASPGTRLNVSLALAISISTINNFSWNRLWTWADRREHSKKPLILQFIQYAMACWVGIGLQFVITKLLVALGLYYLVANLSSIAFAGVFNFLVNDFWTFSRLKLLKMQQDRQAGVSPGERKP